jgi:hypothetical protein
MADNFYQIKQRVAEFNALARNIFSIRCGSIFAVAHFFPTVDMADNFYQIKQRVAEFNALARNYTSTHPFRDVKNWNVRVRYS